MEQSLINYKMQYLSSQIESHDVESRFIHLKTHEERFALLLEVVLCSSPVLFAFECSNKHAAHSKRLREAGNRSFIIANFYQALQEYTESIVYAGNSSEELALGYANRSATLYKLEKYEDCIKDIDRALNLKYPDRLKTKLYMRKGLCLMALDEPNADALFNDALVWLNKMSLTTNERIKKETELKGLISKTDSSAEAPKIAENYPEPEILIPNLQISCVSDAVTIKYSKLYGRHVVATRKIKPGEILVIEKPYCKRLIPKHIYTNCSYCLYASCTMIPCNGCVNVAYCSKVCRDRAWEEYHEIECPVEGMLRYLCVNHPTCVSMRMAILATKKGKKLNELREELITIDQNPDLCARLYSDDGKFHHDDYRSIHCSQVDEDDVTPLDKLISEALWAAITVCILATESEMFGKKLSFETLAKNPDVIFIGGLMFKHLHLGAQIKTQKIGSVSGPAPVEYGHALMAISSLFNHSCDANTSRQWNRERIMIFALYPIEKGEQLFDNYVSTEFSTMKKSLRQANFKRWKFNCECRPCIENWPTLDNGLRSYRQQMLTSQTKQKIEKIVHRIRRCKSLMQKGSRKEPNTFEELVKLIETLFTLVKRPCRELLLANNVLKLYFASNETTLDYRMSTKSSKDVESDQMFLQLKEML